ncbi:uncharacterized protein LOC122202676 [Panthera leo]|uniref:uncharacterized protein LOC122202676 n=1 Tax=Panthera leo TaxID=9689 RepID=UPI001C696AF1|nr:uncharacterized protein LOC122202676 [Panthera leo]
MGNIYSGGHGTLMAWVAMAVEVEAVEVTLGKLRKPRQRKLKVFTGGRGMTKRQSQDLKPGNLLQRRGSSPPLIGLVIRPSETSGEAPVGRDLPWSAVPLPPCQLPWTLGPEADDPPRPAGQRRCEPELRLHARACAVTLSAPRSAFSPLPPPSPLPRRVSGHLPVRSLRSVVPGAVTHSVPTTCAIHVWKEYRLLIFVYVQKGASAKVSSRDPRAWRHFRRTCYYDCGDNDGGGLGVLVCIMVCINFLRDPRAWRHFRRTCYYDCGDNDGGGLGVLVCISISTGPSAVAPTVMKLPEIQWMRWEILCSSIKVKGIRIAHASLPLCSLPWKNGHQLPRLETINPGSLTVPRNSLWTPMAFLWLCFSLSFLKFFISIILYFYTLFSFG